MSEPEDYDKSVSPDKTIQGGFFLNPDISEAHSLRIKTGTCLALLGFHPFC